MRVALGRSWIWAVVLGALWPAAAQTQWEALTKADEFTGEISSLIHQTGRDGEIQLTFFCEAVTGAVSVNLFPAGAADWTLFTAGRVRFRFDGGEPEVVFFENGTVALSLPRFGSLNSLAARRQEAQIVAARLLEAETVLVEVFVLWSEEETDMFSMQGAAALVKQAGCDPP